MSSLRSRHIHASTLKWVVLSSVATCIIGYITTPSRSCCGIIGCQGIICQLHDKQTSYREKVNLLSYAWQNSAILIPSKEQVLVDWLCAAISSTEIRETGDTILIWQCFSQVLRCKRAHCDGSTGRPLLIKSAVLKTVLNILGREGQNQDVVDLAVQCTQLILASPSLAPAFTTQYTLMLQLFSTVLEMAVSMLKNNTSVSGSHIDLLNVVIIKFVALQKESSSPQKAAQDTIKKLLLPCITLVSQVTDDNGCAKPGWSDVTINVATVINTTIFHKDFANPFIYYVKLKSDASSSDMSPPKIPELFFSSLAEIISKMNTCTVVQKAVVQFLPKIIDGFYHHVKIRDNFTIFNTFVYLLKMLNYAGNQDTLCSSTLPPPLLLKTVYQLLKLSLDLDVYNVSWDSTNGGHQLKFLQKLTGHLLNQNDHMNSDWIGCIELLMHLNHMTIEPQMPLVLKKTCSHMKNDCAYRSSQDHFVSHLVNTYRKLRQIQNLIKHVFKSINEFGSTSWMWSSVFLKKISECFTGQPQGVALEIWKLFLTEISSKIVQGADHTQQVALLVPLFSRFLLNIHLIDYSLTALSLSSVYELMAQTKAQLILPIIKFKNFLPSVLSLLHCWGEMRILLQRYSRNTTSTSIADHTSFTLTSALSVEDLSYVHNFVTTKDASLLFDNVNNTGDKSAKYFMDLILMQKMKALLLCACKTDAGVSTSIQNVVQYFMRGLHTYAGDLKNFSWDKQPENVNQDSYPTAHWHLLLNNLPLFVEFCMKKEQLVILNHLVQILCNTDSKTTGASTDIDMLSTSTYFYLSSTLLESADVQTSFLSSLFSCMFSATDTKQTAHPRKKKRKVNQDSLWDLMAKLASTDTDWAQSAHIPHRDFQKSSSASDDPWNVLASVAVDVSKCLQEDIEPAHFTPGQIKKIKKSIKILEETSLEYLLPGNHMRCMLAFFMLLFSFDCENEDEQALIVATSRCIVILLDGSESGAIFNLINSGLLMSNMLTLIHRQPNKTKVKIEELNQALIQTAGRDASAVVELKPCVNKVVKRLSNLKESVSGFHISDDLDVDFAILLLKCLRKVIGKSHVNQEVKDACCKYFNKLSAFFIHCLDSLTSKKPPELRMDFVSKLLDGFGSVLLVHDKVGNADDDILRLIKTSCLLCLQVTKCSQSEPVKQKALFYIRAVCKLHHILSNHLPDNFLLEIWSSLVTMLASCSSLNDMDYLQKYEENSRIQNDVAETNVEVMDIDADSPREADDRMIEHEEVNNEVDMADELQVTMTTITAVCSPQEFQEILNSLLSSVILGNYVNQKREIQTALIAWQQLVKSNLNEEQYSIFGFASQDLISRLQFVLQQEAFRTDTDLVECVLYTQAQLLSHGPDLLSPQSALTCLHSLFQCSLQHLSSPEGASVFSTCYEILNNLLVYHPHAVYSMIPAFINAVKLLMKAVILEGDQDKGPSHTLLNSAYLVTRLFVLMETHKVEFSKVALYIVADFVNLLQKVTLKSEVKTALLPGVYCLLDLCDHHSVAVLHTVLTHGVRQVFSALHSDYSKYHKYKGKV